MEYSLYLLLFILSSLATLWDRRFGPTAIVFWGSAGLPIVVLLVFGACLSLLDYAKLDIDKRWTPRTFWALSALGAWAVLGLNQLGYAWSSLGLLIPFFFILPVCALSIKDTGLASVIFPMLVCSFYTLFMNENWLIEAGLLMVVLGAFLLYRTMPFVLKITLALVLVLLAWQLVLQKAEIVLALIGIVFLGVVLKKYAWGKSACLQNLSSFHVFAVMSLGLLLSQQKFSIAAVGLVLVFLWLFRVHDCRICAMPIRCRELTSGEVTQVVLLYVLGLSAAGMSLGLTPLWLFLLFFTEEMGRLRKVRPLRPKDLPWSLCLRDYLKLLSKPAGPSSASQ